MKITILTLFPEMFEGPLNESILKKAKEKGLLNIEIVNIRNFGIGKHKTVDDTPYGGGVGMVLKVDVVHKALQSVIDGGIPANKRIILLTSAHGKQFNQKIADEFSVLEHLIIICGHYEGIDHRITKYIDMEISIGDFITTGGEIPAMLITDSVGRRIKGVLKEEATTLESFQKELNDSSKSLLEHPHYTKPPIYDNSEVPKVLVSGNHKKIEEWRKNEALNTTKLNRPDLID